MLFCVLQDFILKWTQLLNGIVKIIVTPVNWLVVLQIIAPDFGRWDTDRGGAVVCVPQTTCCGDNLEGTQLALLNHSDFCNK